MKIYPATKEAKEHMDQVHSTRGGLRLVADPKIKVCIECNEEFYGRTTAKYCIMCKKI